MYFPLCVRANGCPTYYCVLHLTCCTDARVLVYLTLDVRLEVCVACSGARERLKVKEEEMEPFIKVGTDCVLCMHPACDSPASALGCVQHFSARLQGGLPAGACDGNRMAQSTMAAPGLIARLVSPSAAASSCSATHR